MITGGVATSNGGVATSNGGVARDKLNVTLYNSFFKPVEEKVLTF